MPEISGNYYLTTDVTLSTTWKPVNDTVLCLNGHSITENAGTANKVVTITVGNNVTFTLTDCAETPGKITHEEGTLDCGVLVQANGTFTMYGGSITGNTAAMAGGVFVAGGGKFTMYGGIITENTASDYEGGGVYVSSNQSNHSIGKFIMNGGTITGNTANGTKGNGDGGGVYVTGGEFTMTGGAITGNTANSNGGGVLVYSSGSFTMSGGSITGNTAAKNGGGVVVNQSTFEMSGGVIYNNSTTVNNYTGDGGGVFVTGGSQFIMTNGKISGNKAVNGGRGGGVFMSNYSNNTFQMKGGTIGGAGTGEANHAASSGGGVYMAGGTFTMSDSAGITGNTTYGSGGGVYMYGGSFTVSGAVQITGNVSSVANNVYLPNGKTITIGTDGLTAGTKIGVTTWSKPDSDSPVKIATGATGGVNYTAIFTPDVIGTYDITTGTDSSVYLAVHQHSWTYTLSTDEKTITASCGCGESGGSVTISAPENLTYDDSPKMVTVQTSNDWQGGNVTPTYQVKTGDGENDWGNLPEGTAAPTNAGTYKATITVGSTTAGVEYTITKAAGSATAPIALEDLVYNGQMQTLIQAGKSQTGTVMYRLGTVGDYSTTLPVAQQAGTYTVYYMVEGYSNYENVAEASVDVTVGKKLLTITAKNQSAYVNGTAPTLGEDSYTVSGLVGNDTLTTNPSVKYVDADGTAITPDMTKTGETLIRASGATASDNYTITYADGKLTVSRRSSSSGSPTYSVTTPDKTENGTVTISPKNAKQGSTVTITVTPDAGYVLGDFGVTDRNGKDVTLTKKSDTEYTFVMPAGQVEVKASFVKDDGGQSDFADVKDGDYFYDAVRWAVEKGVTNGTDATHFSPDASCTRAQIVTFLWRAAGSPEPKGVSGFADVAEGSYYAKAVAWAVENGITSGTSETTFSPDAACTRAQSVTFLWRAQGQPVSGSSAFTDVPGDSYYAAAVAWAAEKGITTGVGDGKFDPNGTCTRAQIATFLYRTDSIR